MKAERALWMTERVAGGLAMRRGSLLLISIPLVFLLSIAAIGASGSLVPIVFGLAYLLIGFTVGFTWVAAGTSRARRATKKLRGLSIDAQLPAARALKPRLKPVVRDV